MELICGMKSKQQKFIVENIFNKNQIKIKNKLVYFFDTIDFRDLENIVKNCEFLICCEGDISHVSSFIKETQLKKTKEADALAKVKQEIADITTGQADIAFSEKQRKSMAQVEEERDRYLVEATDQASRVGKPFYNISICIITI